LHHEVVLLLLLLLVVVGGGGGGGQQRLWCCTDMEARVLCHGDTCFHICLTPHSPPFITTTITQVAAAYGGTHMY